MRRLGQDKLENAVIKYARSDVNSSFKSENCRAGPVLAKGCIPHGFTPSPALPQ